MFLYYCKIKSTEFAEEKQIWFQMDGCLAHNSRIVREYFIIVLIDRPVPDLSPNAFFMWSYLNNNKIQFQQLMTESQPDRRYKTNFMSVQSIVWLCEDFLSIFLNNYFKLCITLFLSYFVFVDLQLFLVFFQAYFSRQNFISLDYRITLFRKLKLVDVLCCFSKILFSFVILI